MELCERAFCRKTRKDSLRGAYHSKYGILWTDGRNLNLMNIDLQTLNLESSSITLKTFEQNVSDVYWSNETIELPYVCVVYDDGGCSIWRVGGTSERITLLFIKSITWSPIIQGVLWHPLSDILCLLTPRGFTLFANHFQIEEHSNLPDVEKRPLKCGSWSSCGQRLILGVQTSIYVYAVDSHMKTKQILSLDNPNISGPLTNIIPFKDDLFICTSEQKLVTEVKRKNEDLPGSDVVGHMAALMNLKKSHASSMDAGITAKLIVLEIKVESLEAKTKPLPGILTPDIVIFLNDDILVACNSSQRVQRFRFTKESLQQVCDIELGEHIRPLGLAKVKGQRIVAMVTHVDPFDSTFPTGSSSSHCRLSLMYLATPASNECGLDKQPAVDSLTTGLSNLQLKMPNDLKLSATSKSVLITEVIDDVSKLSAVAKDTYTNINQESGLEALELNPSEHSRNLNSECHLDEHSEVDILKTGLSDFKLKMPSDLKLPENSALVTEVIEEGSKLSAVAKDSQASPGQQDSLRKDTNSDKKCSLEDIPAVLNNIQSQLEALGNIQTQVAALGNIQTEIKGITQLLNQNQEKLATPSKETSSSPTTKYQLVDEAETVQLKMDSYMHRWVREATDQHCHVLHESGLVKYDAVCQAFSVDGFFIFNYKGEKIYVTPDENGYIPLTFKPHRVYYIEGIFFAK